MSLVVAIAAAAWWLWPRAAETQGARKATASPRRAVPQGGGEEDVWRVQGFVRSGNQPVAGATVQLHGATGPKIEITSGDGSFDFGEQAGMSRYAWFEIAAPGYISAFRNAARSDLPLILQLRPCFMLNGQVQNRSGSAIAGAQFNGDGARGVTDEQGRFVLCTQGPLSWPSVDFSAAGYAPRAIRTGPNDGPLVVMLEPEARLIVRVVDDASGGPVAGAHVVTANRGVTTRADGTVQIVDLAIGRHDLRVHDDDWRSESVSVDLLAGAATEVTLRARKTFAVHGRVVANAPDFWLQELCFSAPSEGCARNIGENRFVFRTAWPGVHHVQLHGWGWRLVGPNPVELAPDAAELVLTVEPGSNAPIRGRVVHLGVPVAGATISLANEWLRASSREDGTFELVPLQGRVRIQAFSSEIFAASAAVEVTTALGETREVTLELDRASAIGGLLVDAVGAPIADGYVSVHPGDPSEGSVVVTRRDGSFYVGALAAGTYHAQAFAKDLRPLHVMSGADIVVPRSDTIVGDHRLVVETRTAPVAGRVVDARGRPFAGAMVLPSEHRGTLGCESFTARSAARSAADGRFTLPDLPLGSLITVTAIACDGRRAEIRDVPAGTDGVVLTVAESRQ